MGIDVALVSETGTVESVLHDPEGHLSSLALSSWSATEAGSCVRFVDPYGDTVFNQLQIPILLAELDSCIQALAPSQRREHLAQVRGLVASAVGSLHTYVKFIGD